MTFFALPQRLLDQLALSDVMDHADRPDDATGGVPNVLASLMHDPHLSIRSPDNPVLDVVGIGKLLRLHPEDPVRFVRPSQAVVQQVKLPAAEVANLLRPVQPLLALS